jgi:iron complex outermembrane receptor protein
MVLQHRPQQMVCGALVNWGFNTMSHHRLALALCAAAPLVLLPGFAIAQVSAPPTADTSQVEEVVVTAQKRSENLQAVPAQVNVVTAVALQQFHATQLADIGAYVPGLQVNSGGTPGQTTLSLRGIAPIGPSATVGSYIDDTPVGSTSVQASGSLYSLDLLPYDVQRIEVLQGPQGTLYGANSLGGLVKYVLVQPDLHTYSAQIGADVFGVSHAGDPGGGGRVQFNAPILPGTLGLLASYSSENTPGYVDNVNLGIKGQNDYRQQSGRLALLWKPTDAISVQLGALFQKTDADGNASVPLDPATLQPIVGELKDNEATPQPSRVTLQHYSAEIGWDLGWAKLVSASSYSMSTQALQEDSTLSYNPINQAFGLPDGVIPFLLDYVTKKVTQEFRLVSAPADRIEWLVGVFYTHESTKNDQTAFDFLPTGQLIGGVNPLLIASLPDTYNEYAAFGDVTLHVTSKLDISGGLRYAHNNQDFNVSAVGLLVQTPTNSAELSGSTSEGVLTYSFNPKYQFTKDIMGYVRIASGYQAGGPNIPYPGVPPLVKSDTLTNYEVGLKTEFWNKRAELNVAAFYIDWKNIQIQGFQTGTGFTYLDNGGTARSEGVSTDGSIHPFAGLTLSGNTTYTSAELTQDAPEIFGLKGDRLPYIPHWSGAAQANYTWPLSSELTAHVGGGIRLIGDRYSAVTSSPNAFKLGAYGALDLNADVTYGRYTVRLFAKNLTDVRAYNYDVLTSNALTGAAVQVESSVIQPRTIGISIDAKF